MKEQVMQTYTEAENYIMGIPKFVPGRTLKDTERLLRQITGDSIKSRVIHIAGTNGKGSVCAYLRSIIMESGGTVGMFISPHLETMRERICIGREWIAEEEFAMVFDRVMQAAVKERKQGYSFPSFPEFLFLMAMCFFGRKNPDYIILETGMGGRLDATNCIANPRVCVITEIGYDHMQYLGNTIEKIAAEKAGIIKQGVPVVFVDKRPESTAVLAEYAKKAKSPVIILKKDDILDVNINNKTIDFSLHTGYYNYVSLFLDTPALYQTENASLAVAAAQALMDEKITPDAVRKGLWAERWPGRMEEVLPGVYLDGAHNEDGVEALLDTVRNDGCRGRRFLLFGAAADKRYDKMIQKTAEAGLFEKTAVTVIKSDRSASIDELKVIWEKYKAIAYSFYNDAGEALGALLADKGRDDIIYIAGSLYLVGQIKSLIRRSQNDRF
ncbi:MAG: bifunctional folylpolyglutamate synthase/dihydrofolate synthase [Lachnospiraceae bacterium]|nr:bifunctional folylpolyglutamate synthase/dihydrofolate synthase [Lachnospiraceae bacterium]